MNCVGTLSVCQVMCKYIEAHIYKPQFSLGFPLYSYWYHSCYHMMMFMHLMLHTFNLPTLYNTILHRSSKYDTYYSTYTCYSHIHNYVYGYMNMNILYMYMRSVLLWYSYAIDNITDANATGNINMHAWLIFLLYLHHYQEHLLVY